VVSLSRNQSVQKLIIVDAFTCNCRLMIPNYKGEIIPYDNPQSTMMLTMIKKVSRIEFSNNFIYARNKENKTINEWMRLCRSKFYVHGYRHAN
jgi:hypothetical protein